MKRIFLLIVLLLSFLTYMACTKKPEGERSETNKKVEEKAPGEKKQALMEKNIESAKSYDDAIARYKEVITTKPNDPVAHYSLGVIYRKKGLDALAAEHLHKSGILFIEQGKRNNAIKAYEELKKTSSKELEKDLFERLNPK